MIKYAVYAKICILHVTRYLGDHYHHCVLTAVVDSEVNARCHVEPANSVASRVRER